MPPDSEKLHALRMSIYEGEREIKALQDQPETAANSFRIGYLRRRVDAYSAEKARLLDPLRPAKDKSEPRDFTTTG